MASLFWTNSKSEPKRRYRFELSFSSRGDETRGSIPVWTVKTAAKPRASVNVVEHQYIDHTFKYPGRVTWETIQVTLVDPVNPDLSYSFLDVLGAAGYKYPTDAALSKNSLSKDAFRRAIGSVFLKQLDDQGKPIEEWELINPFITSIDFGGTLSYEDDMMNEITIELAFDWAQLNFTTQGVPSSTGQGA